MLAHRRLGKVQRLRRTPIVHGAAEGEKGFRCVVILPKGTNEDLTFTPDKDGEDKLLTAQNKWLIAHEEAEIPGAFCGLVGENITLK